MAEATVLVCDVCGRPSVQTVSIKAGRLSRQKDLCKAHLDELLSGARAPKRGRRKAVVATAESPKRRGRPRKSSKTT